MKKNKNNGALYEQAAVEGKVLNRILVAEKRERTYHFLNWFLSYFDYNVDKCLTDKALASKFWDMELFQNKEIYALLIVDEEFLTPDLLIVLADLKRIKNAPLIILSDREMMPVYENRLNSRELNLTFCDKNNIELLMEKINSVLDLNHQDISTKENNIPLKIICRNFEGMNNIIKSYALDRAALLVPWMEHILEMNLMIHDLRHHQKLSYHIMVQLEIILDNHPPVKKQLFFNRKKSNLYREIRKVFLQTAARLKKLY